MIYNDIHLIILPFLTNLNLVTRSEDKLVAIKWLIHLYPTQPNLNLPDLAESNSFKTYQHWLSW